MTTQYLQGLPAKIRANSLLLNIADLRKPDMERIQYRTSKYKDELIQYSWHTNRVVDWCMSIDEQEGLF